jgi:hypothetical protein
MRPIVYDAGVLIAADRNDRRRWAEHRVLLEAGALPIVPAPVVAQVSRTHKQAQLRRFLRGCEVVALDEGGAHRAGAMLGKAGTTDVVDASVVEVAVRRGADILTGDPGDIERLVVAQEAKVVVSSL